MIYASTDLRNEHEAILYGLDILEAIAKQLANAQPADVEDLAGMQDFLKSFADRCHHGKEEGLYFPALEKAGVPRENGPIGVMLTEHVEGRGWIAQMGEALTGAFAPEKFATAATAYVTLLRNHIAKENQVLFAMGDQRLPATQQAELVEAFEKFEAEVMGPGIHEHFHQMLEHLGQKYLG